MKTLLTLLVGLILGAAGYWWLSLGTPGPVTAAPAPPAAPAAIVAEGERPPASVQAVPVPDAAAAPAPAAAPVSPAAPPAAAGPGPEPAAAPPGGPLLLPVQGLGRDQLQDTFTDARSEGRVHDAIDILAPTGTPVLAVADGTVEKLFDSERGGLTVYQFEPGGKYCYYYAHLQRYADGLAEKQSLRRGQVIGYVGSTGNADPGAPHLHFEIHRLGPEKQWWKGESLNPYPVLHDGRPLD